MHVVLDPETGLPLSLCLWVETVRGEVWLGVWLMASPACLSSCPRETVSSWVSHSQEAAEGFQEEKPDRIPVMDWSKGHEVPRAAPAALHPEVSGC